MSSAKSFGVCVCVVHKSEGDVQKKKRSTYPIHTHWGHGC